MYLGRTFFSFTYVLVGENEVWKEKSQIIVEVLKYGFCKKLLLYK